jgi:hypothetical protein
MNKKETKKMREEGRTIEGEKPHEKPHKSNTVEEDSRDATRVDEDLNRESVTDSMRGDNKIPHQKPAARQENTS